MSQSKLFIHPITFRNTNDSTSALDSNAAIAVLGGVSIAKTLYTKGIDLGSKEITNVAEPTLPTSAATKSYIDSKVSAGITADTADAFSLEVVGSPAKIRIASAGIGTGLLGGGGTAITINPNLSLSTLTLSDATDSSSASTGSLKLTGGLGLAKSIYIGDKVNLSNNVQLSTETGANYNGLNLRNTSSTNPETRFTSANSTATASYTNRLRLFSLGNAEATNQEMLELSSSSSGATLNWLSVGSGVARNLSIYNGAITVASSGSSVTIASTLNNTFSTSATAPSFSYSGTATGVAGNFLASSLTAGNNVAIRLGVAATTYNVAEIRYYHVGAASTGNNIAFGINGLAGDILQLNASG